MVQIRFVKVIVASFCAVLLAFAASADDFRTIDGKEYKNVTVSRVEPDGIVLVTRSGISKVYFTELPKEVQERFHYDATKAAAYSTERTANQEAFRKQQEELRRKLADEKNKYWIGQEPLKNQQDNAKNRQDTVQALQGRYNELQRQEDDLVRRIQEAERLPRYLTGQSGSKHYSYLNPAWQYVPDWQKSLSDVRHEKEKVRKQIEQAQR